VVTQARPLVHGIDVGVVEDAIRAVEQRTSGEIRVALARFWFWGDVRRSAEKTFVRLHVDRTRRRNGVLIFLAPWRRRLAVIGDVGAQEKLPVDFWKKVVEEITSHFRRGDRTAGLVAAVNLVGDALAAVFPPEARDVNELPDTVSVTRERHHPKPT
jgi:uncharacterized membrane protein